MNIEPKHEMYLNEVTSLKTDAGTMIEPKHEMYLNDPKDSFLAVRRMIEPKHEMYLNIGAWIDFALTVA